MDEHQYTLPEAKRGAILCAIREALQARQEVLFAYLHGSFAEGRPFRDVDVAVYLREDHPDSTGSFDYEMALSVALSREIGIPVDVRVMNGAPLGFQFAVTKGQVLTSRDEERRLQFVERTWIEYMDFRPLSERMFREMLP